jgi:GNAT superfamily N-acetyltransferase
VASVPCGSRDRREQVVVVMATPRLRWQVRRAEPADAGAVSRVYLLARHAAVPAIPPLVHPDDDVRRWIATEVLPHRETWVADDPDAGAVAMMVLDGSWLDQLYVHPDHQARRLGTALLDRAKQLRPTGLQLWTFQSNLDARRFYERHGFEAVERTDGTGNEERAPDVRYVWEPHRSEPGGSGPIIRP